MLKFFTLLWLSAFCVNCFSTEQDLYPNNDRLKQQLEGMDLLYVKKVGGKLSIDQFELAVWGPNQLSEDQARVKWDQYAKGFDGSDQFIVKKAFDTSYEMGDFFQADRGDSPAVFTEIGGDYLIFFGSSEKRLYYNQCYVVPLGALTKKELLQFLDRPKNQILVEIVETKRLACAWTK